ncbi:MAG: ABC transporter substrate-binding protein [Deltaproteobacteria bacterium]|jgi:microcin C transport system substrate-binding protein|nr:ABC transporter substrate-binding protein [Deltaproteobacteria bacterium]
MRRLFVSLLIALACTTVHAEEFFPKKGWADSPDPFASPDAEVGGEISFYLHQSPKSLNYYLDNSFQAAEIFGKMYESLLTTHPITLGEEPGIAKRWSISDDKLTFTFYLDERARWSDGKPITAHDVRWTYDAILDPKYLTGPHKLDMERFDPPEVIDKFTIRFKAKTVHWRNLSAAGGFHILPKHAFSALDFNKINFEFPVISGPYRIGRISEGLFITMERRDDWWGWQFKRSQGTYNFETIKYKFFAERENAFEAFIKGEIDFYPVHTSRLWVNRTTGDKFTNNWIIKQKIFNYRKNLSFQGFAMNTRKPPFNDVRVRKAVAHLVDRRKMNSTIMYSQYELSTSYYEDLFGKENPNPNKIIELDKAEARKLLGEAGWIANPKTGFLEKDGKPFEFKFLTREASTDKFLAIFAEDLKDVGIKLIIDNKDWAAWARDMDEFNFQMTWAAWGFSVYKDPENMWSSKEADRKGGINITGFKNKTVDELIEKQKSIFDVAERNKINRKIDELIVKEMPYVLLWDINYHRLLYWNKFGTPETVLPKYGDESSAVAYWWIDEDSKADLQDAMQSGSPLPPRPATIKFDEIFMH